MWDQYLNFGRISESLQTSPVVMARQPPPPFPIAIPLQKIYDPLNHRRSRKRNWVLFTCEQEQSVPWPERAEAAGGHCRQHQEERPLWEGRDRTLHDMIWFVFCRRRQTNAGELAYVRHVWTYTANTWTNRRPEITSRTFHKRTPMTIQAVRYVPPSVE